MADGAPITANGAAGDLTEITRQLRNLRNAQREERRLGGSEAFPSREPVIEAAAALTQALFPRRIGAFAGSADDEDAFVGERLGDGLALLAAELRSEEIYWEAESGAKVDPNRVELALQAFAASLTRVRILLDSDIEAAFLGDPAARTIEEILVSYPGAHAILWHRIAHELYRLGFPIVARIMSESANERTGIDIHPGAHIGPAFFIDHGSGVVIGETAVIGARVRLYQQVTLGARAMDSSGERKSLSKSARHPSIGDDVVIYAGATLLGPISVGSGTVIGGNCWILHDIPENAVVESARSTVSAGKAASRSRGQLFGSSSSSQ